MIYQLYCNKPNLKLKVSAVSEQYKALNLENMKKDRIINYNPNYYFTNSKQLAYEKGNEIRNKWINEYQENINKLNQIKL